MCYIGDTDASPTESRWFPLDHECPWRSLVPEYLNRKAQTCYGFGAQIG